MTLRQLTLAAMIAATLVSCSDDDKKPAANATPPAAQVSEQQLAKNAEKHYKDWIELQYLIAQKQNVGINAMLQDMKISVDDYHTTGAHDATAKLTYTLSPHDNGLTGSQTLTFTTNDTIHYDQALNAKGIVAKVTRKIDAKALVAQFLTGNNVAAEVVNKILDKATITSSLFANGIVKTHIVAAPVDVNVDLSLAKPREPIKGTMQLQGLDVTMTQNSKTLLAHPEAFESFFDLKPFTWQDAQTGSKLHLSAINGSYNLSTAGDSQLHINPFSLSTEANNQQGVTLTIKGISGTGKGIEYEPALAAYLGQQTLNTGAITLEMGGKTVELGKLTIGRNVQNDKGAYDFSAQFGITLNDKVLSDLLKIPFPLNGFDFKIDIPSLALESITDLNALTQAAQIPDQTTKMEAVKKALENLKQSLVANKTAFNYHVEASTPTGKKAIFDMHVTARAGELANFPNFSNNFEFLEKNLDFTIDVTIPKDLFAAFGIPPIAPLEEKGDDFVIHVENNQDGLQVNGQKMAM